MQDFEEHEAGTPTSPRHVGLLLAAVVAVAVIVFSLGVMVGKKARTPEPKELQPPSALPTETLVPLSPEDLPVKDDAPTAPESEPQESQKLTFFDRLSGDAAGEPELPKAPEEKKEDPAPLVVRKPDAKPAGESAPPPPRQKPPPSPARQIAELSSGGRWAVQVSSGTNKAWSDDYVDKLSKRGLEARSVSVSLDGKQWYRIWIGSFPDRDTAKKAQGILSSRFDIKGNVVQGD
jgi:septal ring-binding cell division protein DamX